MSYLFDTNILVYYLNGSFPPTALETIDSMLETSFKVSVISKLELLGWRGHTAESFALATTFLSNALIIPVDAAITDRALYLRQHYTIHLPDAIIAATALETDSTLVTRNVTDMAKIRQVKVMDPFRL